MNASVRLAATRHWTRRLGQGLRVAWKALRVWSGDAAYDTYAAHRGEQPKLGRHEFYVDSLRRRYRGPQRCC